MRGKQLLPFRPYVIILAFDCLIAFLSPLELKKKEPSHVSPKHFVFFFSSFLNFIYSNKNTTQVVFKTEGLELEGLYPVLAFLVAGTEWEGQTAKERALVCASVCFCIVGCDSV